MPVDSAPVNLTHHFLIAMPGLEDEVFAKSVVYLCEHTPQGALGLVINKPAPMTLLRLFEKINLPLQRAELAEDPVFQGGPLQTERGFVLHDPMLAPPSPEEQQSIYASTMRIPGGLEMTTSRDVLEAIAQGGGPTRVLVMTSSATT